MRKNLLMFMICLCVLSGVPSGAHAQLFRDRYGELEASLWNDLMRDYPFEQKEKMIIALQKLIWRYIDTDEWLQEHWARGMLENVVAAEEKDWVRVREKVQTEIQQREGEKKPEEKVLEPRFEKDRS